jgi:hypothetical protein
MAAISITNEKAITAGSEISYKRPISALPRNQNTPYPAVKRPYADARRWTGTISATAAGTIDSCTPMPTPQSAMPMRAAQKPPRNTNGANRAEMSVKGIKTAIPNRSKRRPKRSEPVPLTPIATA